MQTELWRPAQEDRGRPGNAALPGDLLLVGLGWALKSHVNRGSGQVFFITAVLAAGIALARETSFKSARRSLCDFPHAGPDSLASHH